MTRSHLVNEVYIYIHVCIYMCEGVGERGTTRYIYIYMYVYIRVKEFVNEVWLVTYIYTCMYIYEASLVHTWHDGEVEGSFAKETYNLKEPTNSSHPIAASIANWLRRSSPPWREWMRKNEVGASTYPYPQPHSQHAPWRVWMREKEVAAFTWPHLHMGWLRLVGSFEL